MITAAELIVLTRAEGADNVRLALAGIGVAVVAAGVESVKMAADFQQSITLLATSAGESHNNLKMVSDGILKMSIDTATGAQTLSDAMFTIESSGYRGATGLAVLKAAAEGAKVENADLTGVVQALATTMHDWHEPASQAIDVMNSFREAASIGNMRMDDFTGAMKNVGPVASLAAIHLTDVEAALSTMSLEGDKGAAAGTHLAQSLLNMISPSSKAQKVLKEIGLTAQQVSDDMKKSLPDTLALITDDIGKKFPKGSEAYNHALSDMFGGTRGLKAILELTGQNLKDFENDASAIAPTMKANSTAVDGWTTVQQNFNFKLAAASDAVNVLMIKLGTEMLPVLGQILGAVTPLITSFGDWIVASDGLSQVIHNSVAFYQQWQGVITTTATALTVFFIPALIKSGVEAAISAATISGKFVLSLIETGLEGWAAAGSLATYIGALVLVGTQAVISAAKVTYSFIAALIETGVQAYVAAYAVSGSFVVSLGMVGTQALAAAGKLLVGFIPALSATDVALDATGAAATVALGPLGVLIAIVGIAGAAFIAMKNKSDEMNLGVSGAFDTMGNKIQRSTGRIIATADQMKKGVSDDVYTMDSSVYASMDDMQKKAAQEMETMRRNTISKGAQASTGLENLFNTMLSQVGGDFSQMSSDAYSYLQNVESYVTQAQAKILSNRIGRGGTNIVNKNFGGYAEGTNYAPGGLSVVGEKGPEIMYIPRGAQIIPNNQVNSISTSSASSTGGGTSSTRPVNFGIYFDTHEMARLLAPALVDEMRARVGLRM